MIHRPRGATAQDEADVQQMNALMGYRGPDGQGLQRTGNVVLGMRRLAIIDLTGGQQPLFNETGDISLVCNGEIYNYVELRQELEARGHRFATHSDCEVLLHLYEDEGLDFLQRVRGMFALALWDNPRQRLVAARDRYGQKPLYRAVRDGALYLSSELKALVRVGAASDSVNSEVLFDTLSLTYPHDPRRTLCTDVQRVPPGTMLVVSGNQIDERTYFEDALATGPEASISDVGVEFERSVNLHLRSDVPCAVLLSGGLDSSAIAAYAAESHPGLTCISAGYSGDHDCDERVAARQVATHLKLPLTEVELDAASFATLLPTLAAHCDEPATDIAAVAQWALYGRCRDLGYRVALSGIGADEVLFGYPFWTRLGHRLALRNRWIGPTGGALTAGFERWLPARVSAQLPTGQTGFLSHPVVRQHRALLRELGHSDSTLDGRLSKLAGAFPLGPESTYAILRRGYVVNNGLQLTDKLSMGQSIEVRAPFMDHVLVDTIGRVPLHERLDLVKSKPVLRKLLASRVPEAIWSRVKRGFTPPGQFIQHTVLAHMEHTLDSPLVRAHFAVDDVRRAFQEVGDQPKWRWFLFILASSALSHAHWRPAP